VAHDDGAVDYRRIAQVAVVSALTDAAHRRRNPNAPDSQRETGARLVAARGDRAAVRLFEYAYLQASSNPNPWAFFRL
jgi:hypothetical protein